MDSVLDQLKTFLASQGLPIRPPASSTAISRAETTWPGALAPDLLRLYRELDGTISEDVGYDIQRHIRIWPIEELRQAQTAEAGAYGGAIVFADYMLYSHEYAITHTGHVVRLAGEQTQTVASSLEGFLAGYINDDATVF